MKNIPKYFSYTKAWERINAAIEAGFNLEAITIEESIISDRLLSYVLGVDASSKVQKRSGLGDLIARWRKLAGTSLIEPDGSDLGKAADEWRQKRNIAVHGMVKSAPGEAPRERPDDFFEMARSTAEDGKKLARKIQNWHKREIRKSKAGK